jgi:hypothetical protein
MKKLQLTFFAFLLTCISYSQTGFYVGGEAGVKWDNFFYINSLGYSLGQYSYNGTWGGFAGYKLNNFTFETGFYGYYTALPDIYINYDTGEPFKGMGVSGSSSMDSWVIPFSFGYDIPFGNDHFFVKPEMTFLIYKGRDGNTGKIGGWGTGGDIPDFSWDTPIDDIELSPGTTLGFTYRQSNVNTGLGLGVSLGWRIKKRADIYFKGTYNTTFTPILYDVIAHQLNNNERISATNTFSGSSFGLQIGFRFYLKGNKE